MLCGRHAALIVDRIDRQRQRARTREYEARAQERAGKYVYFYLRSSDGMVKIGHTGNLRQRYQALRAEHGHMELIGLRFGGEPVERAYHDKFRRYRVGRSEFFEPAPPVLREASKCRLVAP